jgi:16S rRNA (adenine1518-N6/adenine1519-N6)-dimethyltransferase
LLKEGFHVTAVEKDDRFASYLSNLQKEYPLQFKIVNADILRFDIEEWLKHQEGIKAVCGNIPYNISTQIVFKVLPLLKKIRSVLFMVQLEFGERLAGAPATKAYGSLSVYVQLRSAVKLEYLVPRTAFQPIPKVDSTVVSMEAPKVALSEEILSNVEKITRHAFTQRRKKLSNSIGPLLKDIDLEKLPVDLNRRSEHLSPKDYLTLAEILFKSQ